MFSCKNPAAPVNRIHHAAAMWQDDRSLLNQTSMMFVRVVLTPTPVQQESVFMESLEKSDTDESSVHRILYWYLIHLL